MKGEKTMDKKLKPCPFCGGKACIMKTSYTYCTIYCEN